MADEDTILAQFKQECEALFQENSRLQEALRNIRSRLQEPEEIIRAIRAGEVDALLVEENGQEEIYSVQRYEAVYRGVVEEALPYGVWLADRHGQLIYVSHQFLDLVQTDLNEMQEKGQFHFLPESSREAFNARWSECQERGGPCDFEYTVDGKDGDVHIIWTHGILAQCNDGTTCWVGINLDVTDSVRTRDELRRKTQELQEVDRRKDEFIAMLGHELRNPVAVIQHGVDLLQKTSDGDVPHQQVLETIRNQVSHLTGLMDDLLDISRITTGTIQIRKERVDLVQVVHRAVEALRFIAEDKSHNFSLSLPPSPVYLEADPKRVDQVLVNLLSNATKFTMPGGNINVTVDRDDGEAVISIRDNGVGIHPEMLQQVFDLFFQSEKTLDRSQGGLGIGLTLVRNLVELHEGRVEARSAGLGQGSEFIVRLPLGLSLDPPVAPSSVAQAELTPVSLRVLLVDDAEDARKVLGRLLEVIGHEVRTAHDGPSALDAAREFQPQVVLMDIGLPAMDGYEVAQRIRQEPLLRDSVLIAVTGYGREIDRRRVQEAGFDHYLLKPPDIDALEQLLEDIANSVI